MISQLVFRLGKNKDRLNPSPLVMGTMHWSSGPRLSWTSRLVSVRISWKCFLKSIKFHESIGLSTSALIGIQSDDPNLTYLTVPWSSCIEFGWTTSHAPYHETRWNLEQRIRTPEDRCTPVNSSRTVHPRPIVQPESFRCLGMPERSALLACKAGEWRPERSEYRAGQLGHCWHRKQHLPQKKISHFIIYGHFISLNKWG